MNTVVSNNPGSYLTADMSESEKIIAEKGALVFSDGEYIQENIQEIGKPAKWIGKLLGKSLSCQVYEAKEKLRIVLSPKDNSELVKLPVVNNRPIVFEPKLHFARTMGVNVKPKGDDLKNTLKEEPNMKAIGNGTLYLKEYGQIVVPDMIADKPIYVNQNSLMAFEDSLNVTSISRSLKKMVSGQSMLFRITGKGKLWLQTR